LYAKESGADVESFVLDKEPVSEKIEYKEGKGVTINNGKVVSTLSGGQRKVGSKGHKAGIKMRDRFALKFAGDENATDLKITPTDGILQVLKMDPNEALVNNQMVLYPTPTSDYVTARFKLYEKGEITLAVYDLGGKLVFEVIEGTYPIGIYEETFNLGNLPAGEYVAILRKENDLVSERVTKIK
jgi:hypothetical protein